MDYMYAMQPIVLRFTLDMAYWKLIDEMMMEKAMHIYKHARKMYGEIWKIMVQNQYENQLEFYLFKATFFDGDDGVEQPKCETSKICANQT